jgi:hypothetical protein
MNFLKPELKTLVYICVKQRINHPESASHRWFSGTTGCLPLIRGFGLDARP